MLTVALKGLFSLLTALKNITHHTLLHVMNNNLALGDPQPCIWWKLLSFYLPLKVKPFSYLDTPFSQNCQYLRSISLHD